MSTSDFFRDKSVLITGASSGIGEELAWQLAQLGARLTLTARRRELLHRLAQRVAAAGKRTPLVVEADVTRDGDLERAVSQTLSAYGSLDVVIANAGFGVVGPIHKLSLDDYRRQFETNVFGVLRTIYAAVPALEKSHGSLAIMGSVSGWAASPGASPYSMSKFAVRSLANAITPELRASGIKVTLISPGFVASNFFTSGGMHGVLGVLMRAGARLLAINEEEGAATSIHLATAAEVAGITGRYFEKQKPVPPSKAALDLAADVDARGWMFVVPAKTARVAIDAKGGASSGHVDPLAARVADGARSRSFITPRGAPPPHGHLITQKPRAGDPAFVAVAYAPDPSSRARG